MRRCLAPWSQVGNTPGVTKALQEVHLDKNIKLLDSPGVVFADAEDAAAAALRNAVKIERLADPGEWGLVCQKLKLQGELHPLPAHDGKNCGSGGSLQVG